MHSVQPVRTPTHATHGPTTRAAAVPATVEDASGRVCLLVLPSDRPAPRAEAAAVEALLGEMVRDPSAAARRACEWRAGALSGACAASLAALLEIVQGGCGSGGSGGSGGGAGGGGGWQGRLGQWRFKQAGKQSLTGGGRRGWGREGSANAPLAPALTVRGFCPLL